MFENTKKWAEDMDKNDPLSFLRDEFHIPENSSGKKIYFCGNSLGLQPKMAAEEVSKQMSIWQNKVVEGHFTGDTPWMDYHKQGISTLEMLTGAKAEELAVMNNLTTNLHLLLSSFYRPFGNRTKILIEKGAFPSDHYVAESQIRHHGLDPVDELLVIEPNSEGYFELEHILELIQECGETLALVFLPAVQYYSGQFFDLKSITKAAHQVGALAGFDLAHAIGNLPLHLHENGVDFAAWCSYKYLNSGPGNVSGIFIHNKHFSEPYRHRLTGWWGHDPATRFLMTNNFIPAHGAEGWMLANSNIISHAAHIASLEVFAKTQIDNLRKKSKHLTGYLEYLILNDPILASSIKIVTPRNPDERGCQLSLSMYRGGKDIYNFLSKNNVVVDWREPNVIRMAPTPMYNTFAEVYEVAIILRKAIENAH